MKLFFKLLFIVIQINLIAQTSAVVNINKLNFPFNNYGNIGNDPWNYDVTYIGKPVLYQGGIMISGYSDSTLWASCSQREYIGRDYLPGKVGSNPNDSNNIIYAVRKDDPDFGNSWHKWKYAVEQGAYFYDGDGNGIYDPIDHNGNGIWEPNEDRPDLLYDATYFTVYNDAVPTENRRFENSFPIGIEIRQTIFASSLNSFLEDVIFIRYSLLYKGYGDASEPDTLTDVIFSIPNDPDIGDFHTDKIACDTSLHSGFAYKSNVDWVFGINPPSLFRVIVQGPLVKSNDKNDAGYNRMGPLLGEHKFDNHKNLGLSAYMGRFNADAYMYAPATINQARNYMEGKLSDGTPIDPCNFVYGEFFGGINCEEVNPAKWFSGDPVTQTGWIAFRGGNIFDLTSTGKFNLIKNQPMDIIIAYVVGQGDDYFSSITVARDNVRNVFTEYENNFPNAFEIPDYEEIYPKTFSLSQNYPNPFNPVTKIKYAIPGVGDENFRPLQAQLIVYDILGREVKTLVNEPQGPGNYEITFDASQLASGVYFYRLSSGDFISTKKMILLR